MLKNPLDRAGIAIAVVISAIGYVGGIRPVAATQAERLLAERTIASKQATLDVLREDLAAEAEAIRDLEDRVHAFRAGFVASPRTNERIGEVAEVADVIGIAISSMRPGEPTQTESLRTQPISMSGNGTPDNCAQLLSRFRAVFPDMGVRSFSMTSQSAEDASIAVELVWFAGSNDQTD